MRYLGRCWRRSDRGVVPSDGTGEPHRQGGSGNDRLTATPRILAPADRAGARESVGSGPPFASRISPLGTNPAADERGDVMIGPSLDAVPTADCRRLGVRSRGGHGLEKGGKRLRFATRFRSSSPPGESFRGGSEDTRVTASGGETAAKFFSPGRTPKAWQSSLVPVAVGFPEPAPRLRDHALRMFHESSRSSL